MWKQRFFEYFIISLVECVFSWINNLLMREIFGWYEKFHNKHPQKKIPNVNKFYFPVHLNNVIVFCFFFVLPLVYISISLKNLLLIPKECVYIKNLQDSKYLILNSFPDDGFSLLVEYFFIFIFFLSLIVGRCLRRIRMSVWTK